MKKSAPHDAHMGVRRISWNTISMDCSDFKTGINGERPSHERYENEDTGPY